MAKTIITLGREYCTGGRYIAEDVANALGIKLYDKELITMAAKHSGLSEEAVAASEKRHTHSLPAAAASTDVWSSIPVPPALCAA